MDTSNLELSTQAFTQSQEIRRELSERGFADISQSTISRLLRRLGVAKAQNANGKKVYTLVDGRNPDATGSDPKVTAPTPSTMTFDSAGKLTQVSTLPGPVISSDLKLSGWVPGNVINGTLQGDFKGAGYDTGRFLVNSTLGLGGLLDVAKHMNLPADTPEDFGQTLATWGVGQGPYLVLPLLGPSTVRDTLSRPVDWYTDPTTYINHEGTEISVKALSILDARAGLLELEKNITGDRYVFIRDVYLQRRAYLISNGEVTDDFGAEDFSDEDFEGDF